MCLLGSGESKIYLGPSKLLSVPSFRLLPFQIQQQTLEYSVKILKAWPAAVAAAEAKAAGAPGRIFNSISRNVLIMFICSLVL